MSDRDRGALAALGILVGALVFMSSVGLLTRYGPSYPQANTNSSDAQASYGERGPAEGYGWPEFSARDTYAQWAMAAFAFAATGLSVVGVVLIRQTFLETRRTANAAEHGNRQSARAALAAQEAAEAASESNRLSLRSAEDMQINAEREQRAYISVNPAGVLWVADRTAWIGHVEIVNVGRIPASRVRIRVEAHVQAAKDFSTADQIPAVENIGVIHPGVAVRQGSDQFHFGNEHVFVFVYGIVNYVDGFGQERWTKFCHRYATAAREVSRGDHEFFGGVAPANGRQHQWGNDAT